MPHVLLAIIAVAAAFLTGMAIQRGNTCTVAAIDKSLDGDHGLLIGILEAMVGIAGLYGLLHAAGGLDVAIPRIPVGASLLAGALLLGAGASLNGACATGTIARIGSGNPVFVLTPLGILAGAVLAGHAFERAIPPARHIPAPSNHFAVLIAAAAGVYAVWRLVNVVRRHGLKPPDRWTKWPLHPRAATALIALLVGIMTVSVGPWAYTDYISQLSRGHVMHPVLLTSLVIALVAGSVVAGLSRDDFRLTPPTVRWAARCLAGGMLIGVGLRVLPGAHDSMTLVSIPLGSVTAAIALLLNAVVIVTALTVGRRVGMRLCACSAELMTPGFASIAD